MPDVKHSARIMAWRQPTDVIKIQLLFEQNVYDSKIPYLKSNVVIFGSVKKKTVLKFP